MLGYYPYLGAGYLGELGCATAPLTGYSYTINLVAGREVIADMFPDKVFGDVLPEKIIGDIK